MGERRGTKALELWCRRITEGYPGVKIENMSSSWRDGLAFCAMIHHFRPDLIEFEKLNKTNVYFNNDLAFTTAEKYLGIPALLDAVDMATYEVPDRLSILTYLSQFYQMFAAHDSPNRLKRPSTAEKSQITKTSGPPTKMAHVVGVPKRDPCQKCKLPVFLAERLMVGKKVYHRTCLKCARCGSQLTPGSFYETEIDDEYCCETCPDEEHSSFNVQDTVSMRSTNTDSKNDSDCSEDEATFSAAAAADNSSIVRQKPTIRNSIADRLAFFEQNQDGGNKVLQKSLSDEEKSKSLSKMNEFLQIPPHKISSAQSHFMTSILKDDNDEYGDAIDSVNDGLVVSPKTSKQSLSNSDSEQHDESENSVELRSSRLLSNPLKIALSQDKKEFSIKNSDYGILADSELTSNVISSEVNSPTPPPTPPHQQVISTINESAHILYTDNMNNIVLSQETKENVNNKTYNDDNNIFVNELNDKIVAVVTKDEFDVQMRTNETNNVVGSSESESSGKNNESFSEAMSDKSFSIDPNTTNRLSVVRARLHQFEGIANNITEKSTLSVNLKTNNNNKMKNPEEIINKSCALEIKDNEIFDNYCKDDGKCKNQVPINDGIIKTDIIRMSIKRDQEKSEEHLSELFVSNSNSRHPNGSNATKEIDDESENANNCHETGSSAIETNETNFNQIESAMSPEIECSDTSKIADSSPSNVTGKKTKLQIEEYPEDLNPFKSDDDNDDDDDVDNEEEEKKASDSRNLPINPLLPSPIQMRKNEDPRKNFNPFDSSDDEIEMEKKVKPPRPPPPRISISKNPFGSESEDDENFMKTMGESKKPPVPAPRINLSLSQNPTPEPTPRLSAKQANTISPNTNRPVSTLNNSGDCYGSSASLGTPIGFQRNSSSRESTNSLSSSTGTMRSRKSKKGPAPPPPVKELFPSTETIDSKFSTPNSSSSTTPSQVRKKRPAPAPPKPARLFDTSSLPQSNSIDPKNLNSYPLQSDLDKLSDEEKVLLEGKEFGDKIFSTADEEVNIASESLPNRRVIPLDFSIVEDAKSDDMKHKEEDNVVYRRTIVPHQLETPTHYEDMEKGASHDRQLEKMKDNKEAKNRNRQSQISSSGTEDTDLLYNKSSHGKWKRRKGPAPALPVPPRKILQMLPLQEIKHELEIIEVQQQGLEKQGVILEKMIRDRCEGQNGEFLDKEKTDGNGNAMHAPNSKEVEDLILQLFELVNEKNELFRRQAELMYLRRQHRLEQEQADIEYEIRVLMAQPERNKTDSDKTREESLIGRLVKVVQLRNEVVDCLEMDRLREAEEDLSIKQRLESHAAKREEELQRRTLTKLSKKEKKKLKETKKLGKKKLDADKDADETEIQADKQKMKKKKKKFLF